MGGPPTPLGNFGRGGKQLFRGGNCPACPYCCYGPDAIYISRPEILISDLKIM